MLYIFNCMGILKLCKKLPPNTNVSVGVYTAWIQPRRKEWRAEAVSTHCSVTLSEARVDDSLFSILLTWGNDEGIALLELNALAIWYPVTQKDVSLFPWQQPILVQLQVVGCRGRARDADKARNKLTAGAGRAVSPQRSRMRWRLRFGDGGELGSFTCFHFIAFTKRPQSPETHHNHLMH